jgi:acyl-CoA thioesterase-1
MLWLMSSRDGSSGSSRKRSNGSKIPRWAPLAGIGALALVAVLLAGVAITANNGADEAERAASQQALEAQRADATAEEAASAEAAIAAAKVQVERPTDRPLEVVFAGDSLTYGLFASSEAAGYRPQVVAGLETDGAVKWSRGGQTGNRIQTVSNSIAFPASTDLVVLALGTNDVWKTPVEDIATQYDALMQKAKAGAPNAAIVCLGVWSKEDGRRGHDPAIQQSCEAAGGRFLPLGDIYDAADTRGPAGVEAFGGVSDDFHPNDNGYRQIAQLVLGNLFVS